MSKLAQPPKNFETAVAELENIVEQMERGQLSLDDLLGTYKRGAELVHYCRERLQTVEQQVQLFEDNHLKPLLDPKKPQA